jgi:MFS transporter, DHA1 family, inner membrane transport protein
MRRGRVTWYSYLVLGFFTYLLNIQGNIIPFLKAELNLGYASVSLHSSALAAGLIAVGLRGDRVTRRCGRRRTLQLGIVGISAGAVLLCIAPAAWASIASCALMGAFGGLIPSVIPAILADAEGAARDVAYGEATAMSYGFGILAPLVTGLCVVLGLGWRGAVAFGVAIGAAVIMGFWRTRVVTPVRAPVAGPVGLPARYWAYWSLLGLAVAIEFCVLLWAPAYLERVAGLPAGAAAGAAAVFSLAMVIGRAGLSVLVRRFAPRPLFLGALALLLLGFAVYWAGGQAATVVGGLFLLGLGIAPLYPLVIGFAMDAAAGRGDAASARIMLAVGLAILSMPAMLGGLADAFGLGLAHLMLPGLAAAALAGFVIAGSPMTGPLPSSNRPECSAGSPAGSRRS